MASIKPYTLSNGKIKYEYFISNGINPGTGKQIKIHKRGFDTIKEAEKAAKIIEGQIASGDYLSENPAKMTIEQFFDIWISQYKQAVKEGTRIVHRRNIKIYIKPFIGKYSLEKYTGAVHQKFINELLTMKGRGLSKQGLSVTTVKNINATISNAFKKAVQLKYVKENPTLYTEFPRDTARTKPVKYYTFEQSEQFLDCAKKQHEPAWYPFFCLIFEQGLRKAEVLGLQWKDIDFTNKTVDVVRERLLAAETGENKGAIITDDTKTPSGVRQLPLSKISFNALLTFRNHILKTFGELPVTEDGEDFIFIQTTRRNYGKIIRDRSTNGAAKRIEKMTGLPHIKVHDGRHTFAVRARQAGVPLEDIKDLLGHKEVSMTQVYAHISPEVKERSMNLMEEYLDEQRKKALK